ncbi:MAG: SEC-C domain-containing protein [Rhodospirillaceae bacterium]|nr:SEC-C domain-containing protein [Rhodospirillales bacterium]
MSHCPCNSGRSLDECCGPILAGTPAPTAEALMRSRYTAFLTGQSDYLDRTLAAEKREEVDQAEVAATAQEAKGEGVEIRAVTGGGEGDDTGTVEYVARFHMRGQKIAHHELANFRRDDGGWVYVDGEMNPQSGPRQVTKVGRNDPCPCGSGAKYKKCCGA